MEKSKQIIQAFGWVSLIILLFSEHSFGQVFFRHNINTNFDGANSVYAIDLDNDGDTDVLGTARVADVITWWENDGSENFTRHNIKTGFDEAKSVFAIDLDEDGEVDVLGAADIDQDITWWKNDGSENFTENIIKNDFDGASSVFAIDLDGDLDIDVLGTADNDNDITWWENDGMEGFTEHNIDHFFSATSVYAADLNGDGDIDVLGVSEIGDDIIWWENDGMENFTKHPIDNFYDGASSVHAIDLDSDGDIDVLGTAFNDNDITWWENDGLGNFTENTINGNYDGANSVYGIDIDADGDIDIVGAAGGLDDVITWWENDGSENFTEHTIQDNFDGAKSVYPTDIDGDGDIDVLGAAQVADDITWWEQGIAWTGNGNGIHWNDPNNWSSQSVPTANDPVNLGGNTVTILGTTNAAAKAVVMESGAVLNVNSGGNLSISLTNIVGLQMTDASLNNFGTISISGNSSNLIGLNIDGTSVFNNEDGGVLNIDPIGGQGISTKSGTTFNNKTGATITINNGNNRGIQSQGTFVNEEDATITINNMVKDGFLLQTSVFTNNGTINIGPTVQNGLTLFTDGERFINSSTGVVSILGSSTAGIFRGNNNPTLTNNGTFIFGADNSTKIIDGAGTFAFNNNNIVQGVGTIEATHFNQNIGGVLVPGNSAGILIFDSDEDFSNGTLQLEILDNDGVAGTDFDQIQLTSGTATIGGTLDLTFSYSPTCGQTFKIIDAAAITGTFSNFNITPNTVTVNFDNATGEVEVTGIGGASVSIGISESSGSQDNDGAICVDDIAVLDAGSFDEYLWSTNEITQTISVSMTGNYAVTVTDSDGCTNEDIQMITATIPPSLSLSVLETSGNVDNDGVICSGESATLDIGSHTSYLWSTGETSQMISVTMTGNYSVVVSDANGCTGEEMQMVTSTIPSVSVATFGSNTVAENTGDMLSYRFTRTICSNGTLTINFSINGTASDNDITVTTGGLGNVSYDESTNTGTITFPNESSTIDLTISSNGDLTVETDETVAVKLEAP